MTLDGALTHGHLTDAENHEQPALDAFPALARGDDAQGGMAA